MGKAEEGEAGREKMSLGPEGPVIERLLEPTATLGPLSAMAPL